MRRRRASHHETDSIENAAAVEANKRIGSAGLVEGTSPWAATLGRLTTANSRPTNPILKGGGDVSSLVMRTLQTSEKLRPGQSTKNGVYSQPKRLHVTMSPTSQFQQIQLKSSQFGPETAVTSEGLMSQTTKSKYVTRKEHKKQEELEASQMKTLHMYRHVKFFKDYKRDMVLN